MKSTEKEEALQALKTFVEAKRIAMEAIQKINGEELMGPMFAAILDKYPELEALRFQGYAPGFNDGDPCIFHIHGIHWKLHVPGIEEEEDEDGDCVGGFSDAVCYDLDDKEEAERFERWHQEMKKIPNYKELMQDVDELSDFVNDNEEAMQIMFGESFEVIVDREGIHVDDCYDCGY